MELEKFCPRCGEESAELHGDRRKLCTDCYPEKNDLLEVPEVVEITVCPVCGRMHSSGEWLEEYTVEDQLAVKFSEFSRPEVEMEIQYWEEDDRLMARVHARKEGMEDSYDSEVRFEKRQCGSCSKFSSGFYKVKIQLRGDDVERVSNRMVDIAAEVTDDRRGEFLSNVKKTDGGFDLFLSSEDIAGELLDDLRSRRDPEIKRSYELVGESDGQKQYRNVVSVRL